MTVITSDPVTVICAGHIAKDRAQELFGSFRSSMGMTKNIFSRRERTDLKIAMESPNVETLEAMKDIENGKVVGPFHSVKEMVDSLDADD